MIPGRKTVGKFFPVANPNLNLDLRGPYLPDQVTFARASIGTYWGPAGTLLTAAADVPRFEYDRITLQPQGLLVETERSFLGIDSEDFAGWGASDTGGGFGAAVAAPDGTLTATSWTVPTSTSQFAYGQKIIIGGVDASGQAVYDIWVRRPAGAGVISLNISDITTVTSASANQAVDATWRLLSYTSAGLTNTGNIGVAFNATPGDVFEFWHPLLGLGTTQLGSYLPTADSAVLRAGDAPQVTLASLTGGFDYNQGTIAVRGNYNDGPTVGSGLRTMLRLGLTSLFYNGGAVGNTFFTSSGSSAYLTGPNTLATAQAAAMSYTQRGFNLVAAAGETAITMSIAANIMDGFNGFGLGYSIPGSDSQLNGHITGLRYWKYDCDPSMVTYLSSENYWNQS